jgi:hypothetical protein
VSVKKGWKKPKSIGLDTMHANEVLIYEVKLIAIN